MRVGPVGAGVRRAAVGITGDGPVMRRGAWAAKEKAKAATKEKMRYTDTRKNTDKEMSKKGRQIIIKLTAYRVLSC